MPEFLLRTNQRQPIGPQQTPLLDWFPSTGRSTIQARGTLLRLQPPQTAREVLQLAAAVYCIDKVVPRPPAAWTRSLALSAPVGDPDAWQAVSDGLVEGLSFLSGDHWRVGFHPTPGRRGVHDPPRDRPNVVCLFSGGLDSLCGTIDLLAQGARVCLVSHYEAGQAPDTQVQLARALAAHYGRNRILVRRLFLRPAPSSGLQERPLPTDREPSTRSRSLLFIGAGVAAAAAFGDQVPLVVPENGYIGINVPLTAARNGSLSTRTTHSFFLEKLCGALRGLGLDHPIENPYRLMTKGEMLERSQDPGLLQRLAPRSLSCAHPEAARYVRRRQGNCGYCFPCLIRRAALHRTGMDSAGDYAFDALREDGEMQGDRGADLRALLRSLHRPHAPVDVLRNGPLQPDEVVAFADVHRRGREELLSWLHEANPSPHVRRQLPANL